MIINNENLLQNLNELLKNKNFNNKQWSLLYRSSRDGCKASDFHSLCDNRPNTLTIINDTSGNIFGGYKNLASNFNLNDKDSFIFSLVNRENKALIFEYSKGFKSNGSFSSYGPMFGSDIVICDSFNSCNQSYSNLGTNYYNSDLASRNAIEKTCFLAGSFYFQVAEIEVFQLN